ncbi:MAG TPA: hypothetical protein VKP78_07030 [bacterium]|nr:hypothetical protein [bacterium]
MDKKIAFILIISYILAYQQTTEFKNYTNKRAPKSIEEFPETFQRHHRNVDELKTKLSRLRKANVKNPSEKLSKDFLKKIAASCISIKMFYSKVSGRGLFLDYGGNCNVASIYTRLNKLGYPYNYFLPYCDGIVLAEVIKDTSMERIHPMPSLKCNNKVLFAEVIDDLFNTIEEDTVLVRHDYPLYDEEYNKYNPSFLLFGLEAGGGGAIYKRKKIHTYHMTGTSRTPDEMTGHPPTYPLRHEHVFVKNGVIYDPYRVYNIDGKEYRKFKKQFIEDVKKNRIRK